MSDGAAEKGFVTGLIAAVINRQKVLTEEEVRDLAKRLAVVHEFEGDVEPAVHQAIIAVDTKMGRGVSIVDSEAPHDSEWVRSRSFPWTYSDAYEMHLRQEGWPEPLVQSLSDVCYRILGHLQDPTSGGAWDRRGLVIGHVQSGKTANYLGVVSKAADAGYKFIVVIAGIHNNLRRQTQERVDEGFIGRSSDPAARSVKVGVGLYTEHYPHPATLTNIYKDFNSATAANSGWEINDFSKPIIVVIKKNVSTLKSLYQWLDALNSKNGLISDVPMLLIDDEADNASINTNKDDLDPTKTNKLIRETLGLFGKSCYVGYTATPFANIFINPDAYDQRDLEDLFPRDFIYSLDPPTSYFGPDKVFINEATSDAILREITDCEDHIPSTHTKDDPILTLPPSLYEAVDLFVLARTIRNLRGQANKHCSMMVNVSRFVAVQRSVRDLLAVYERRLRQAVLANFAMPEEHSRTNSYMERLRRAFESEYSNCGFDWAEVKAGLAEAFSNLRLFVINSKSDEALDYKKYEDSDESLTALAVGGLSLSRGLTIEGLCISYMYRNTSMYDTLMQMGRWFGYRPGYEDLCRVYLSGDSVDWYAHIAEKTEELRQQIRRMSRDGLTPREFGLYVGAHPDRLLITAPNKMRHAEQVTFQQSFSGRLLETYILPKDEQINLDNEALIQEFWRSGFGGILSQTDKGWYGADIDVEVIRSFLARFKTYSGVMESNRQAAIDYLKELSDVHPLGDVLLISIQENGQSESELKLGTQRRDSLEEGPKATKIKNAWWLRKDRVASRGDEKLGLALEQIQEATNLAVHYHEADSNRSSNPSDAHFREVRKKPLLMVHMLGPVGGSEVRVPAYGISFPFGNYLKTVEVVANKVLVDQLRGSLRDDPDEEDDFDE